MSAAVDPSAPIAWTPGVQLVSRLSRADGRQLLLTLASFDGEDWYAGASEQPGSWGTHWAACYRGHGGKEISAPATLGNAFYPAGDPAPGRFIHQR